LRKDEACIANNSVFYKLVLGPYAPVEELHNNKCTVTGKVLHVTLASTYA